MVHIIWTRIQWLIPCKFHELEVKFRIIDRTNMELGPCGLTGRRCPLLDCWFPISEILKCFRRFWGLIKYFHSPNTWRMYLLNMPYTCSSIFLLLLPFADVDELSKTRKNRMVELCSLYLTAEVRSSFIAGTFSINYNLQVTNLQVGLLIYK